MGARKALSELAAATGVNKGRLSMIENGIMPTLAEHQAIEAALQSWEHEAVRV